MECPMKSFSYALIFLAAGLGSGIAAGSASAEDVAAPPLATLIGATGKILVNQGAGFKAAKSDMVLNPADQIMVGSEGRAEILYLASQCRVVAEAQSFVTVAAVAPCVGENLTMKEQAIIVTPVSSTSEDEDAANVRAGIAVAGFVGVTVLSLTLNDDSGMSNPPN
jgi:hypothetical protein